MTQTVYKMLVALLGSNSFSVAPVRAAIEQIHPDEVEDFWHEFYDDEEGYREPVAYGLIRLGIVPPLPEGFESPIATAGGHYVHEGRAQAFLRVQEGNEPPEGVSALQILMGAYPEPPIPAAMVTETAQDEPEPTPAPTEPPTPAPTEAPPAQ